MAPASPGKGKRLIIRSGLTVVGLLILFTLILILSLPSLAAPTKAIPAPDLANQQNLMRNLAIRTQASAVDMVLSGRNSLPVDLSAAELNALFYQGLSQKMSTTVRPVGSLVEIQPNGSITFDLAANWQERLIGLHAVTRPSVNTQGALVIDVTEVKLGRVPVPRRFLGQFLRAYLPQGVQLNEETLQFTVSPMPLPVQNLPPLVKNPQLFFENLSFSQGKLRLLTRLLLRT